jgi:hypothetical protein
MQRTPMLWQRSSGRLLLHLLIVLENAHHRKRGESEPGIKVKEHHSSI